MSLLAKACPINGLVDGQWQLWRQMLRKCPSLAVGGCLGRYVWPPNYCDGFAGLRTPDAVTRLQVSDLLSRV